MKVIDLLDQSTFAPLRGSDSERRPPLHLGVLISSARIPLFAIDLLKQLAGSAWLRIEILKAAGGATDPPPSGWALRWYRRWDDRFLFGQQDPIQMADASDILAEIGPVTPVDAASAMVLDVIVDLRGRGDGGAAARFGVWHLHHAAGSRYSGEPAAFWEVYHQSPLSGAELRARTSGDPGEVLVLGRCVVATSSGLSWSRNRVAAYWPANALLLHKLAELQARGWGQIERRAEPIVPERGGEAPDHRRIAK